VIRSTKNVIASITAFGPIPMWRVAAVFEGQQLDIGDLPADTRKPFHGAVLVVLALHRNHGAAYARQTILDVPPPRVGIQPKCDSSPSIRWRGNRRQ
jgi:hypothetical protein